MPEGERVEAHELSNFRRRPSYRAPDEAARVDRARTKFSFPSQIPHALPNGAVRMLHQDV